MDLNDRQYVNIMIHKLNIELNIKFPKIITYDSMFKTHLDGMWNYRVKITDVSYIYTAQNPNDIMRYFETSLSQGIIFERQNQLTEHINKEEFHKYICKKYIG